MTIPRNHFLPLLLALAIASAPTAHGQGVANGVRPSPHLAYTYPAGARQGSQATLSVGGQNLAGATVARISGPGITTRITGYERPLNQKEVNELREKIQQLQKKRSESKPTFSPADEKELQELRSTLARRNKRQTSPGLAETVTIEVTVAADAPVGAHELRLQTPAGLSNPLVFQVGTLPEFTAAVVTPTNSEPSRTPQSAGLPAATPPAGFAIQLPAVVNGQILPGEVDRIRFAARQGQQLTIAACARALIPYLADAVPGWFQAAISLRDAQGRELAYDDDFQFRPDPVLACLIPADGDYVLEIKDAIYRGREDFVYRIAIGELPFVRSVFPLGANRRQPTTVELTGWNLPSTRLTIDPRTSQPGLMLLSAEQNNHASNAVRFAVGDLTEAFESEPNETAGSSALTVPVLLNGRIDRAGDRDVIGFRGRAGEQIVAEILARRLDSPLDSSLALTDSTGRQLAFNDDFEDKSEGLLTHQADSRVTATLPGDGIYYLTVTDTQHRGGPEYGYRLSIGPPHPDFALRVVPSALNVPAGASVPLTVFALRRDGFQGEILLTLRDNPAGFRLSGARIPAGADSVTLTLTAPGSATDRIESLQLAGRGIIGGKPVVHHAVAADDTMQAFLYRHLVPARAWEVTIAGRGIPFRLVSPSTVRVEPGVPTIIQIAVPGVPSAIADPKVELINPPAGFSIGFCESRDGRISFSVLCDSAQAKAASAGNLIVAVSGQRPNRKGSGAKSVVSLGVAPAIPFDLAAATSPSPALTNAGQP